jgi:hypothetical protein
MKLETLENGNMLIISLAEPQDAGDYTCLISDNDKPTEQRHSIKIRGKVFLPNSIRFDDSSFVINWT